MEQLKRVAFPAPRGLAITAIVVVVDCAALLPQEGSRRYGAGGRSRSGKRRGGPPAMPPMPVDVDTARVQTIVDAVRATGRIEAVQAVELRPDEQGRVTALCSTKVRLWRGRALVRIDDAMLRAQAERAKAERDLARQQLERVRRLREQNAASPADLERAEAAARRADAALAVLQLQIARSPCARRSRA